MIKKNLENIIFDTGLLIISFITINTLVSSLFFMVGLKVTSLNFWTSIAVLSFIYLLIFRKKDIKNQYKVKIISLIFFSIILLGSIFTSSKIYDLSYDGNYYHKTAIGLMKHGWNPVYQSAEDFSGELLNIPGNNIFKWVNHYQNLSWIFGSSIYAFTGNIESAKSLNILLIFGVFFLLIGIIKKFNLNIKSSLLIAFLSVFSPIVLSQVFSFYIDGNLSLMFYLYLSIISLITFNWLKNRNTEPKLYIALISSIIIILNLKLNGLVLLFCSTLPFLFIWLRMTFLSQSGRKLFIKLMSILVVAGFMGITVVGSSSYVKNLITKKNPFYPLVGQDRADIITTMQPKSFEGKNQIEKLLVSVFSKSENVTYASTEGPRIKIPLTFDKKEIKELSIADTRIGGFGIFYSFIFILTISGILIILALIFFNKTLSSPESLLFIAIFSGCIFYLMLPTENWWARYAPNVYMMSLVVLFAFIKFKSSKKILKISSFSIASIMSLVMFINAAVILINRNDDIQTNKIIKDEIYILQNESKTKDLDIIINEDFAGILFNLLDKNIDIKKHKTKILGRPISVEEATEFNYRIYCGRLLYR